MCICTLVLLTTIVELSWFMEGNCITELYLYIKNAVKMFIWAVKSMHKYDFQSL